MNLTEAKEVLKEHGYLLSEAKYKYKVKLTFFNKKDAFNCYLDKNEDYACTDSNVGNVVFFWFNDKNELKKLTNEYIDTDKVQQIEILQEG